MDKVVFDISRNWKASIVSRCADTIKDGSNSGPEHSSMVCDGRHDFDYALPLGKSGRRSIRIGDFHLNPRIQHPILALAEVASDIVLLAGIDFLMKTFNDFFVTTGFFWAVLSDTSDMDFSKETAATSLGL